MPLSFIKKGFIKKGIAILALSSIYTSAHADIVSELRDAAKLSEEYRELTINCYIDAKLFKQKAWKKEACSDYKVMAKTQLQAYRRSVQHKTKQFREFMHNDEPSIRRIKKGLKQLAIIQFNLENIRSGSKKIKMAVKSK